jgi:protein-disulfide isomerase
LFWDVHEQLFENQRDFWGADRDYYVQTAVSVGADQTAFEACYDSPASLTHVQNLDDIRRQWGVYSQPTFDVNGQIFSGAQPFSTFEQVFLAALP